ncbi:uncharacterized protein LOC121858984 [Homarus americanus]|uniref:uncharacterized protein LOC121858984 n=1 Tax=Homarus americanus TaxID=6706 RepID=UPI001C44EFC0|nr:uncharacterized protein LOC121858984 [Homarus americanus]
MLKWRIRSPLKLPGEMSFLPTTPLDEISLVDLRAKSDQTSNGNSSSSSSCSSTVSDNSSSAAPSEPNTSFLHRGFVTGSYPSHEYYDGRGPCQQQQEVSSVSELHQDVSESHEERPSTEPHQDHSHEYDDLQQDSTRGRQQDHQVSSESENHQDVKEIDCHQEIRHETETGEFLKDVLESYYSLESHNSWKQDTSEESQQPHQDHSEADHQEPLVRENHQESNYETKTEDIHQDNTGSSTSHNHYDNRKQDSEEGHQHQEVPRERDDDLKTYSNSTSGELQKSKTSDDVFKQVSQQLEQVRDTNSHHYACPQNNKPVSHRDIDTISCPGNIGVGCSELTDGISSGSPISTTAERGHHPTLGHANSLTLGDTNSEVARYAVPINTKISVRPKRSPQTKYFFGTIASSLFSPAANSHCHYAAPRVNKPVDTKRNSTFYYSIEPDNSQKIDDRTNHCIEAPEQIYDTPKKYMNKAPQLEETETRLTETPNQVDKMLQQEETQAYYQDTTKLLKQTPKQHHYKALKKLKETMRRDKKTPKRSKGLENHYKIPRPHRKSSKHNNETPKKPSNKSRKDSKTDKSSNQLKPSEYESYDFKTLEPDSLEYALDFKNALGYHLAKELREKTLKSEKENDRKTGDKSVREKTKSRNADKSDNSIASCSLNRNEGLRKSRSMLGVDKSESGAEDRDSWTSDPQLGYHTYPRQRSRLRPATHTSPLISSATIPDGIYVELFPFKNMSALQLAAEGRDYLMWCPDHEFDNAVSALDIRGLVELVQTLQDAMAVEQQTFDSLSQQLELVHDPLQQQRLSAALCTSQTRLARLCSRNMRCFRQQALKSRQKDASSESRSSSPRDSGLVMSSAAASDAEGDPRSPTGGSFRNSLAFFQRAAHLVANNTKNTTIGTRQNGSSFLATSSEGWNHQTTTPPTHHNHTDHTTDLISGVGGGGGDGGGGELRGRPNPLRRPRHLSRSCSSMADHSTKMT